MPLMTDSKTDPREVTIKIPRLPRDKGLAIAGGIGFLIAFIFASTVLGELNQLKEQQKTAEERIKKEVLMPGGTTEYKTEFKPDQKVEAEAEVKPSTTSTAAPARAPEPEPEPVAAPVRQPATAPVPALAPSGPGNFDSGYTPSYGGGRVGPGNM